MKLIRFGAPGRERPGLILPDGRRIDASSVAADYDEAFFASGGLERLVRWFAEDGAAAPVVPDDARLGPPIGRPSKIVCVGLNYRDHARESGMAIPDEPVLFFKATTAITGPNDDVIIPTGTPPGVGLGQSPPRYLVDDDEVELGIEGLGTARQRLRASR